MKYLASGTIIKTCQEKICVINYIYKDQYVIRYWMESIDDKWLGANKSWEVIHIKQKDIVEIYQDGTAQYQQFNLRLLEIGRKANKDIADLVGEDSVIQYPCGGTFGSYVDGGLNRIHDLWLIHKLPQIVHAQDAKYATPQD